MNEQLINKLNTIGCSIKKVLDFDTRYQLLIITPLSEFYVIESETLNDIKSSIAFGFTFYTSELKPTRISMYNIHPLRNGFGLTTTFDFSTIDDLVEKVIATTKSLANLSETTT